MASRSTESASSRLDELVSTAPGTPAGRYLRTFWNPIYHSIDLKVGRPVPLRIMSESFTLYRGDGGAVHLVEARCPHRGTQLSAGRVEADALRCFYHGWKFGGDGRCIEQPADESRFCDKAAIRAWPAQEYLGGEAVAFELDCPLRGRTTSGGGVP